LTVRKHLKVLVRARMAKTGESYVTARRQILRAGESPPVEAAPRFLHFPGNVPAAASLRILLANAGVLDPHTGRPFSEAMTFGIGGGVGAGVFAFHYAKENFSSFFVAGRHLWQDDVAWMKGACARFGAAAHIRESSSPGTAGKALAEALGSGPAIAWVDRATLPYHGLPAWASGGSYHILAVYSLKDGKAVVGDLADIPIEVSGDDLAAARARIKKQKNRLLSLEPGKKPVDLQAAIRSGLKACAEGLVNGRMRNFTLDAFRGWAERIHGSKGKDSWEAMFPPGLNLRRGLVSINEFIEHWGTGGGLMRPLMGEFLLEASDALRDPRMKSLGERYSEIGRQWSALASAALPDGVPALREARENSERKSRLFLCSEFGEKPSAAAKPFSMTPEESDTLRQELKSRIVDLCDAEEAAQKELLRLAD
jgi:hypothetical protein